MEEIKILMIKEKPKLQTFMLKFLIVHGQGDIYVSQSFKGAYFFVIQLVLNNLTINHNKSPVVKRNMYSSFYSHIVNAIREGETILENIIERKFISMKIQIFIIIKESRSDIYI